MKNTYTIQNIILISLLVFITVIVLLSLKTSSSKKDTKRPITKAGNEMVSMTNAFSAEDVLSQSNCPDVTPSIWASIMYDQCMLLFWPDYISMMFGKSDVSTSIPTMCDVTPIVSKYGYYGVMIANLQSGYRSEFTLRFTIANTLDKYEYLVYLESNSVWAIKIVNVTTTHSTIITDNTNYTSIHDGSFNFCGRIGNNGVLGIGAHPASLWISMP